MYKILFFLLMTLSVFGQQESTERFELNALWKFQVLSSAPFGNNAIAKAHNARIGFGAELGVFRYSNFRLGFGYNIMQYGVSDKTMIGNIKYANYTSTYGFLSYEIPVVDKISILPDIGYGYAKLHYKGYSKSFGWQDGNEFRLGTTANYYFSKHSSVYLGVHYIHTGLDIKTHPEFEDFFGKMNQVQFALGLQFD